jgi:hypothetical protein
MTQEQDRQEIRAIVPHQGRRLEPLRIWRPPAAKSRWKQPMFIALFAANLVLAALWLLVLPWLMGVGSFGGGR